MLKNINFIVVEKSKQPLCNLNFFLPSVIIFLVYLFNKFNKLIKLKVKIKNIHIFKAHASGDKEINNTKKYEKQIIHIYQIQNTD